MYLKIWGVRNDLKHPYKPVLPYPTKYNSLAYTALLSSDMVSTEISNVIRLVLPYNGLQSCICLKGFDVFGNNVAFISVGSR